MSAAGKSSALAAFSVRAFRYQWPADLATSWAFEMETLILGWYVLVETGSVLLLTLFASLLYIGTLIAPMYGVIGDRIGHRNLLCMMRGMYALLATTLMVLALSELLTPTYVLVIAAVMGLVRPSDIGMRSALVAVTMPPVLLLAAMSIQRTTQDTARIAGALTGAGVVAKFGMGPAYMVIASLYTVSILLSLKAGSARASHTTGHTASVFSPWRDLKEGLAYVWNTPFLCAVMCLAFLLNMTAFPQLTGFQPYVAKEVYGTDQTGLGYMVAAAAFGALTGSVMMSRLGGTIRAGRTTVVFSCVWYVVLLVFAQIQHPLAGIAVLMLAGGAQSISQIPMTTMLLRNSEGQFRGRIMGIRMLAIYGNVPGLLLFGPLVNRLGYTLTATLYCVFGLAGTLLIVVRWRRELWHSAAPANAH